MTKSELMEQITFENNGVLRLEDAIRAGVSKTYVFDFIRKNEYEQAARGIYLSPDAWEDGMYILQMRYKDAIFSMNQRYIFLIWQIVNHCNILLQ